MTRFGRYQLQKRIAIGGMAELWRAAILGPSGFSKTVAIKKILPDLNGDPRFRERFLHEGRLMGELGHRNLVQIFELGEVDGELYMSLEFVPGCDLATVIEANRRNVRFVDPYLAAWIGRELCQGLGYVHGFCDGDGRPLHIVHRDVNPHNILLSLQGDVKLGDFGIARSVVMESRTQHGHVVGKLEYLAPEQARGATVGTAADLFAIGMVLYEMLSSDRYNRAETDLELYRSACEPTWRSLRARNPEVPEELEALVQRLLRPDPEARFSSARACAAQLSTFIQKATPPPGSDDCATMVHQVLAEEGNRVSREIEVATLADVRAELGLPALKGSTGADKSIVDPPKIRTVSMAPVAVDQRRFDRRLLLPAALVLLGGLVWLWPNAREPGRGQTDVGSTTVVADPPQETGSGPDGGPEEEPDIGSEEGPDGLPADDPDLLEFAVIDGTDAGRDFDQLSNAGGSRSGGRQRARLAAELGRLQRRLMVRGIRRQDDPEVTVAIRAAKQALARHHLGEARRQIDKLARTSAAISVDRAFIERKIVRLQKALARRGLESRYAERRREILRAAVNNRYREANAALNAIFDEVGVR